MTEFCRQHNVSTASFYNWRRKFRDTDRERGEFVPVNVTQAEPRINQPLPVRIVWPQGVIMEIPATDRELVLLVAGSSVSGKGSPVSLREVLQHLNVEFLVSNDLLQSTVFVLKVE